jgi:protein phosphatase
VRSLEIPDPCLVVLVGPAGAGKSTLAARLFAPDEILSSDAYRRMLTGDENDQRASGLAFRRLHEDLARRLGAGYLTVVDATNVTPHARRVLLGRASDARVPAVAIVLDLPADVVHARNAGREARVVPPEIVDRHLAGLGEALGAGRLATDGLEAEGFEAVWVVRDPAELDALRIVRRDS